MAKREPTTINKFVFEKTRIGTPKVGTPAKACGWLFLGNLSLDSGELWIGDPYQSWAESRTHAGCIVRLPKGTYRVTAKIITFGKGYFCSNLRVCQQGVGRPAIGKQLADTGTDTGKIGVCDVRAIKHAYAAAFPDGDDEVFTYFHRHVAARAGVLQPAGPQAGRLLFVESGFGDGLGPVFDLRSDSSRVGVEAEFIASNYRFGEPS